MYNTSKTLRRRLSVIHVISSSSDSLMNLINDDPVRPHIPFEKRISAGGEIWVLMSEDQPQSVVCVSFQDTIPATEEELFAVVESPTVAVLYTIWAIKAGGGQKLVFAARYRIKDLFPTVKRLVTLSPQTDMARKFHLRNGAIELRMNATTVNFEYNL